MKKRTLLILGIAIMASMLMVACSHEHEYGEWTVATPATCTEDGIEERTCTKGDDTETRAIPATGHDFGSWNVVKEATCFEEGEQERICNNCGEKEAEIIPVVEGTMYTIGESAMTDEAQITINKISYINVLDKQSLSEVGYTAATNHFYVDVGRDRPEGDGMVYMIIGFDFTNLSKKEIQMPNFDVIVDYNDGYIYKASKSGNSSAYLIETDAAGAYCHFDKDVIGQINYEIVLAPLASDSYVACIPVPELLSTDIASPITITFDFSGGKSDIIFSVQ